MAVLIHRGAWCPYGNSQLAAFACAAAEFAEGIAIVSISADDRETSEALVAKHACAFPVGYGADAAGTGAYVNESSHCLKATGFILDGDGRVQTSVYSSGAIGRLMRGDVLNVVRYLTSRAPAKSWAWGPVAPPAIARLRGWSTGISGFAVTARLPQPCFRTTVLAGPFLERVDVFGAFRNPTARRSARSPCRARGESGP